MKILLKLYDGDTSHALNSLSLVSHTFYICSLSVYCFMWAVTPSSLCLLQPWAPRWYCLPTFLSLDDFQKWAKEIQNTVFFENMMPELLGERWKLSQSSHLMSNKKICHEFIGTPLPIDYGLIQKLNLHKISRMRRKIKILIQGICLFRRKWPVWFIIFIWLY